MAKYSSRNSLLSYSKQVYVRGGEQYLPGDRQLTATMELRLPALDRLELVSFADVSRLWGAGSNLASEDKNVLAGGFGLRLPPVLGSGLELGWARQLSGASPHDSRFYLMVRRILPF